MRLRRLINNKKGFSLIELAIGVALLAVLVGAVVAGSGMMPKMKVQRESDTVNSLRTAAQNYLTASQTTYTGVSITVLKTAGYLPNFNSTGTNQWAGNYTVAVNGTTATSVDISLTNVPDAATGTLLTNNFPSAVCTYTASTKTWTATFS